LTVTLADQFEAMIREAGEGWLIDCYAPREKSIPHLLAVLARADETASRRLGADAPRITAEALIDQYAGNPHKVRAFLQVMDSVGSPLMLVMVWRILEGIKIEAIRMEYDAGGQFHLYFKLSPSSTGGAPDEYESNDIDDAVILRHLGTMQMGNQGAFEGFYAFNLGPR
jgi:hypothetical protein